MKLKRKLNDKQKQKIALIIQNELKSSKATTIKVKKSVYVNLIGNELADADYLQILKDLNKNSFDLALSLLDIELVESEIRGDDNATRI